MDQLSHADLQSVDKRLGSDFIFDYEKSVETRTASGGTVSAALSSLLCFGFSSVDVQCVGGRTGLTSLCHRVNRAYRNKLLY